METNERAIVRIIAPIEVLAGVLLLAAVATFAAMTANPAMDVPGAMERLGSMPVVLALFALVTATTLLDEQLALHPGLRWLAPPSPTRAAGRSVPVIALPESTVLAIELSEPEPSARTGATGEGPWWAEWIAQADQHPDLRWDQAPVIDLEEASRPLVDLSAGRGELVGP